ncbi:cation transport protein-domain-containing protein [Amylocarpus encephaloides]|uniref:Potassium transport protein n=1 Tax=Amylocarpus encephaloides TaxID=45428 RepID=A0A9P7YIS2_9HELO|nr:cation transport protein-domain-containing protein [Amylocarpus encephaloides]
MEVWSHIASLKPAFLSRHPHFSFITVHYFWIIGMAIVGSICIYANGDVRYIDALFLGSGAATQSGLNTIDVNLLTTWQQMILYFVPMLCNPITINSFVVFLRLYWFEKRFQHVAKEAKKNRRSMNKTISRSKTYDLDLEREERGVRGRSIVVMHDSTVPNGMTDDHAVPGDFAHHLEKVTAIEEERGRSSDGSRSTKDDTQGSESGRSRSPGAAERGTGQIKFVDQIRPSETKDHEKPSDKHSGVVDDDLRRPSQRTHEEHIAILERQRKQDDGAVLRIPGPRDADAGVAPQAVDTSEGIHRLNSRRASTFDSTASQDVALNADDHPTVDAARPRITITEPIRSPPNELVADDAKKRKFGFSALRFRGSHPSKNKSEKVQEDPDNETITPVTRTGTLQAIRSALTSSKEEQGMPYLSWEPTVGRNSAFVDLSEEQREELGGIEYRSLKALALILILYFWGFSLLSLASLLPWILKSETYGTVVTSAGQGRVWWGFFTANAAFTDLGFTLTPDSMVSFQTAIWPLLIMSFMIVIGNTGFPIMLRIIIWVTSLYVPKDSGVWEELKFLLDHPRRCFTLLFPSKATWWLFWILVILNGLDLLFFIVLDFGNSAVTRLPVNIRLLDGWFQAASTRTAGFSVVNLSLLHPAIQVSYMLMMYISVLPIAISVRRTNVYEEDSLGIYGAQEEVDTEEPSYVKTHLRRQLSFDLWYIFLGLFIISISEGPRLQSGDPGFNLFSVLFEIVSAYGTVGLSLGYPDINASFSAEFGVIAKLVIIAMQIRGRHRGLPYDLDKAILLPSELLQAKENTSAANRQRRNSGLTQVNTGASRLARTASRATVDRNKQAGTFLSSLLHPGPTIPNSHRIGTPVEKTYRRRHSIAATPSRRAGSRSLSPTAMASDARGASTMDPHRRGQLHVASDEFDEVQVEYCEESEVRMKTFESCFWRGVRWAS